MGICDHADFLRQVSDVAVRRLPQDASLVAVERSVADAIRRACKEFNQRHPDVIVIAHEMDPRCARAQANTAGMTGSSSQSLNVLNLWEMSIVQWKSKFRDNRKLFLLWGRCFNTLTAHNQRMQYGLGCCAVEGLDAISALVFEVHNH